MLADGAAVEVALDPTRAAILDALTEPGSATTVAGVLPPSEGDVMNDPTRPERVATARAVA